MATKTLTITEGAYMRLKALKEDSESFSDVIDRLTGKSHVSEVIGILSPDSAEELRKNVANLRKKMNKDFKERTKQWQ